MKKLRTVKTKFWVIGLIALAILALIIFGLKKKNDDAYSTFSVKETTVSDQLLLAGTIDAKDRVDLGFATSGRVKAVNFNVGDTVKKGQVIAEVEQNRLASELTNAQAGLTLTNVDTSNDEQVLTSDLDVITQEQNALVNSAYRQFISGDLRAYSLDDNDRNIQAPIITGNYLSEIQGEYVIDMYSSGADSGYSFRLSGLGEGTYTAENNNAGKLGEDGLFIQFFSDNNYGNTDWVVPVPNTRSATYIARKSAYENALAARERVITAAENNIARSTGTANNSEIARSAALRNQARARVNGVATQLSDGKIRAPFDGIIARNDLEIGEIVNAFSTEIIMFGGEEKELNLNTPEIYINKIAVGDSVAVTLDAFNDIVLTGTVSFIDFIDTEVDGVPVYKTDIVIDTLDDRIRSGMNAKASIISEQRENVLAVPAHYIQENENGEQYVLVSNNDNQNTFNEVVVATGLRGNEGLVEVLTGLKKGDIILSENK